LKLGISLVLGCCPAAWAAGDGGAELACHRLLLGVALGVAGLVQDKLNRMKSANPQGAPVLGVCVPAKHWSQILFVVEGRPVGGRIRTFSCHAA
jgi:hypothetical protein